MIDLKAVIIAVAASGAAGFAAGWSVHSWKTDAGEKRDQDKAVVQQDVKAEEHEEFKAKERIVYRTITKEVAKIVEKPFYVNNPECLDDDGMRVIAAAIRGEAPSQPASAVPRSGPPSE